MNVTKTTVLQSIHESFLKDLGLHIQDDEQDFFQSLHVDSLAFLNVIARLEKTYEIRFINEDIPSFNSSNALAESILAYRQKGA